MNFFKKNKIPYSGILWAVIFTACFIFFQQDYLLWNFSFFLGIFFIPFIFRRVSMERSRRYFFWALLIGLLLFFYRSASVYYLFFSLSLLFLLEQYFGKLNYLPLFLLGVISSFFHHLVDIWGFPIRLELSTVAGRTLAMLGYPIEITGNVIHLDGATFSVDPACMGLKMMVTALLIGLLLMAYFEKKHERYLNVWQAGFGLFLILVLAIFSNFIRLLILILFHILPENPWHEILGLVSLIVYVVVPFYFMLRWCFRRVNLAAISTTVALSVPAKRNIWQSFSPIVLLLMLILNGQQFLSPQLMTDTVLEQLELPSFAKSRTPDGVFKLENEDLLIYLKPPVRPFQGSHDPRICWQGSGYEFTKVQKEVLAGIEMYTATLVRQEDELYTAWWFDNGKEQTTGEWEWRWESLKNGAAFRLVNVSSHSRNTLEKGIEDLLQMTLFE